MSTKYRILKYNGDDSSSYAIFKASHVKGKKGIIMPGQATPVMTGLTRPEANYYKKGMENK